jgi:hypothetical protein
MSCLIKYRVIDSGNGYDLIVVAKSAGHAAKQARKLIASEQAQQERKFHNWKTDRTSGGWRGVSIEPLRCRQIPAQRATPRPERSSLPWKKAA